MGHSKTVAHAIPRRAMASSRACVAPASRAIARKGVRARSGDRGDAMAVLRAARRAGDRVREVWIETDNLQCVTTAVELGVSSTVVVSGADDAFESRVRAACAVEVLKVSEDGLRVVDASGTSTSRARVVRISTPEECEAAVRAASSSSSPDIVVMDANEDWGIIPAENLVAAYASSSSTRLFARVRDATNARTMLEALETGVDGVVLCTSDPKEVRAIDGILREHFASRDDSRVDLVAATVTDVKRVGAGDRCAVDACVNFAQGEGMLVGSFASGLFLVHAENVECGYVNTRPFRVNAGPTASYCAAPDDKTAYLSELKAGSEILCCDSHGRTRVANVARVKIERRSLVLIEARVKTTGARLAVLLQNAETVRLIRATDDRQPVSVAQLTIGDDVLVAVNDVARHTGVAVDERAWDER
jgi:3-dehydroquinate synthase class II